MSPPPLLFVYGSLLRGQPQDGLVAAFDVEEATTMGQLYLVPAGYPVLVPDPQGKVIQGELRTLHSPSVYRVLDLYEGVGSGLYRRQSISVRSRGRDLFAQAYVLPVDVVRRRRYRALDTGDWRRTGLARRS